MISPPASLLDRLMTSKLTPARARATVGIGERSSAIKGSGMEFVDHRPYREGDDTRHLDAYVLARTGDTVIRQYAQSRQLPVTILLDASGSMNTGNKSGMAAQIAQVLGYVALAGGDRLQIVASQSRGLRWSQRWQGGARAREMFQWVAEQSSQGEGNYAEALRQVMEHLPRTGMLILISDWWDPGVRNALGPISSAGHEVIAFQILAPEEREPERLGEGVLTVVDAETDETVLVSLDAETIRRYAALCAERQRALETRFSDLQWTFFSIDSDSDLNELVLRTLRMKGVLS